MVLICGCLCSKLQNTKNTIRCIYHWFSVLYILTKKFKKRCLTNWGAIRIKGSSYLDRRCNIYSRKKKRNLLKTSMFCQSVSLSILKYIKYLEQPFFLSESENVKEIVIRSPSFFYNPNTLHQHEQMVMLIFFQCRALEIRLYINWRWHVPQVWLTLNAVVTLTGFFLRLYCFFLLWWLKSCSDCCGWFIFILIISTFSKNIFFMSFGAFVTP